MPHPRRLWHLQTNEMVRVWMPDHCIQVHFPAAVGKPTDLDILLHQVALSIIVLGYDVFEVGHRGRPLQFHGLESGREGTVEALQFRQEVNPLGSPSIAIM